MRTLVVGGGGREHALCWAIAASPLVDRLWCAPGNAGIASEAECVAIAAGDVEGIEAFASDNAVDLVVVGPEAPLAAGLVDRLEARGVRAFGPSARAARIESSKGFMKDLCARHGIPTAAYGRFSDLDAARGRIAALGAPVVVKADGLAAGKGVVVCATEAEAGRAAEEMLAGRAFGDAGGEIVVEEFLEGEELSFFALVDGEHALPLASAQDHKRVGEGDTGPNTGGMGACSPAPACTGEVAAEIMATVVEPAVAAMRAEGSPYKGVLYAGIMLTADGPRLLEFNARFGDPECQALMPRLRSDIVPALVAACDGELADFDLRWSDETALTVVMAARGYPGPVANGSVVGGLEEAASGDGVMVFHAATARGGAGEIVASGGRVLGVTACAPGVREARDLAYRAVDRIVWPEGFCRRDIGRRAAAGVPAG